MLTPDICRDTIYSSDDISYHDISTGDTSGGDI